MLNRALILATVTLLIGCFAAAPLHAQATNLEAGKSPSQIFAGTCSLCHKSPRGLLKTMSASALPGFLRQHYTTSPEMAGLLSSYLVSNGASDKRYQGKDARSSDGKPEARPGSAAEQPDRQRRRVRTATPPQDPAARSEVEPAADGVSPQREPARKGRNARRLARPTEEGAPPPEGETAKDNGAVKPAGEDKSESARIEAPKETAPKEPGGQTPAPRADPVPAVTPAPAAASGASEPAAAPTASAAKPAPPAAPSTSPAAQSAAVESATPPPAAPAPSGSPVPPISR